MKYLLLPIAISIGLPVMTLADEIQSFGAEPEVNQSEQQAKVKHAHRKHKGQTSAEQSGVTGKDETAEKPEKKKVHDHKKVHK